MKVVPQSYIAILTIIILSFWAAIPLFQKGYFTMHDDTQVARVIVMGKALRNSQFPVRWVSDLGYGFGYPIFNFYGPLPYYVGGFFYALGLNAVAATKLMFAIGIVAAGIAMYICAYSFFKTSFAALISAVLLLYAPYHAVQIYVRGAVGEYWSLVFIPLVVYSLYESVRKSSSGLKIVGSFSFAGIILSHTIIGFISTIFIVITILASVIISFGKKNLRRDIFISFLAILLGGLGISAFFWLPAYTEMNFTNVTSQIGKSADFRDHFVCLPQLWNSLWGYGGSASGCVDGMSFKLGKLHLLLALFFLAFAMFQKGKKYWLKVASAGLAISIVSILLMLKLSEPLWDMSAVFAYIQYPWRMLTYTIFGLSLLGGGSILVFRGQILRLLSTFILISTIIWLNGKLFYPQNSYYLDPSKFESLEELRFRVSKISDEYLPKEFKKPQSLSKIADYPVIQTQELLAETDIQKETYIRIRVQSSKEQDILLQRVYFPGWKYLVNSLVQMPELVDGLPQLTVPKGGSTIEMRFVNTPVRTLGNGLSILSILLLMYIYGYKKNKS